MPRPATRIAVFVLSMALLPLVAGRPGPAKAQSATADRLILKPSDGTTFRVQAVYPNSGVTCEAKRKKDLRARYRGRLEIVRQSDGGIAIINHLTFDEYLRGLAEVPRSWPYETLKAQVVAARSYGLYHLNHPTNAGERLGYDICSTDQCQVYRGVQVEQGAFGDAWIRAVAETRGRALLYNGAPIQAFYHSTSPGKTKRSFPGGSPLPYLASVDGRDDDSPLARWTVRIPLTQLGPILTEDDAWSGGRITSVRQDGSSIRLSGGGGSSTIGTDDLRGALNREAACVYPNDYPGISNGRKLPQTVPSIDYTMEQDGTDMVLTGRGWGHGVGMSQYGARFLGENGRNYADILAYYYNGVRPQKVDEPGVIRVLVVEDARLVRVGIEGEADVETGTGSALAPGDRFEVRGGSSLDVRRGVGPSLTPILKVDLSTAPVTIPPDGTIAISYTLSGSAKVFVIVRRGNEEILRTPEVSQISGPNVFSIPLGSPTSPTPGTTSTPGASPTPTPGPSVTPTQTTVATITPIPLAAGPYEIVVEAFDGIDRVRTAPVALTVEQPAAPEPEPGPDEDAAGGSGLLLVFA
ncbi:MAG: SpoIID/LytB domain-containing protein, partial [Actinomycetota bacterium]